MIHSVGVTVSIDWEEELVDNDRSNFYMRLTPKAVIKKIGADDSMAKKVGKTVLDNVARSNKNIKVNK